MLQIVDYLLLVLLRYQSPLVFWLSLLELLLLAGSKFDEVESRSSKSRSTTLSKILNPLTRLWRSSHKNWQRSCWKQYYLGNEDTSDNLLVYCKFWIYTKDSKNLISPGKKRGVVRFWSIFFNFLPCNIWKALLKDNKTEMVQHSLSWTLIFIAELK